MKLKKNSIIHKYIINSTSLVFHNLNIKMIFQNNMIHKMNNYMIYMIKIYNHQKRYMISKNVNKVSKKYFFINF